MTGGGVLEQALWFARFGVPVVPCFTPCRCTIRGAVHCDCHRAASKKGPDCAAPDHSIGKHPRTEHGLSDATTDAERIAKWWDLWPRANLAIRTGADAGLWGLDVDPRHGGDDALVALEFEHGPLPETATVRSGSGGRHVLFALPEGLHVTNSSGSLPEGLDVRGEGGYLVAPGSEHPSGGTYEWLTPLATTPLAPAPDWLLALIGAIRGAQKPTATAEETDRPIPSGRRHTTLVSLAGTMRRRGFGPAAILAALRAENDARCVPPLEDGDVERIAADIAKKPPAAAEPVLIRVVQREERPPSAAAAFPPVPDSAWRGWFGLYRDTMAPTTEAPLSYHLASALVGVGLALGRSCHAYQAGAQYPNIFSVLMGESGIKKDTAIKLMLKVLEPPTLRSPAFDAMPGLSSAEGLIARLVPGVPVLVTITEMSTLLRAGKRESTNTLFQKLTGLFDCPPKEEVPTRKDPLVARYPFLSILAASTPDWFDQDVTEDLVRGGFLGRFLFFTGDPQPLLPNPPKPDPFGMLALRTQLHDIVDDMKHRAESLGPGGSVEVPFSDDGHTWFNDWYMRRGRKVESDELSVLFKRVPIYVQKVALLYAVMDRSAVITAEHLQLGLEVVQLSQAYMRARHARWGASEDARLADKVLEYVHANDCRVSRRALQQHMSGRVKGQVFRGVVDMLVGYDRLVSDDRSFRCSHPASGESVDAVDAG